MSIIIDEEDLSYSDLKDKIREQVSTVLPTKERIMLLAKKLEADLVKKDEICTQICKDLGDLISERHIRRCLPDEYKNKKQQRGHMSASEEQEEPQKEMLTDGSFSASESATGPDGNEVEQEVEQYTAPSSTGEEIVKISKVEYEELREAARPQPTKASELKHENVSSGVAYIPHSRVLEVFIACKQTGSDGDLEFVWTEGKFVNVNVVRNNDIPKTKQENTEASH